MNQPQNKKPQASPQGAQAKPAGNPAQAAYSAMDSTRKQTQNVLNMGAEAARQVWSSGATGARGAQERVMEMSREGVENLARSADMCTRVVTEMASIARENVDACIEAGTIGSNLAKEMGEEIAETCNKVFTDCVELSKEALACRTINDVMELQNRAFRQLMDHCFSQSSKLCGMAMEGCNEAMEPINERIASSSEQLCKAMAN